MDLQGIYHCAVFVIVFCTCARSFEFNTTGCLKTEGCISFPASCGTPQDCDYLVIYTPGKHTVLFEMSAKNEYIGFGLNGQPVMSGTDSIVCSKTASNNGSVLVGHYILPDHRSPSISKPTPPGLTNMSGVYENGIIKCRFERTIKATPPMKYDLNKKYYLIYARGPTSESGALKYHKWRGHSAHPQALTSTAQVKEDTGTPLLIAVHAGLMFLAWLGFASVGIFTARNLKRVFSGELCCGLKTWFQVHRTCMVFATFITFSSVVVIFVYKGGLSIKTAGWHAIIGIIVVSLATLQPIIAFFRPSKESQRRYIFNWVHRCIAVAVFILAITNCFLGLRLSDLDALPMTNHLGVYITLGFIATYAFILLLYEVFSLYSHTEGEDTDELLSAEVKSRAGRHIEETPPKHAVRSQGRDIVPIMAFSLIILLAVGACTALITILILSMKQWQRN